MTKIDWRHMDDDELDDLKHADHVSKMKKLKDDLSPKDKELQRRNHARRSRMAERETDI